MVDYSNQADAAVADLPNVGPVTGSELLYADNGTADVNITTDQIKAYAKAGLAAGDVSGLAAVATSGSASDLGTGTLPNARLSAVPNSALANSGVTISGHLVNLGGSLVLVPTDVSLGNVTNDAQTKAAVLPNTAPAAGQLPVGSGTAYVPKSISGDATLASTGALTVTKLNGVSPGPFYNGTDAANLSGTINNARLSAIPNTALANSSITIAGHVVALGGSQALTASDVGLGSVTNDAQTKAAIVPNATPSAGQVLIGNSGGTAYSPQSVSGDISVLSTGAATVAKVQGLAYQATTYTDGQVPTWSAANSRFQPGTGGGGGTSSGKAAGIALDLQLSASVASNKLTVAVKNSSGADPSSGAPVQIPFRDTTLGNGGPVWRSVQAALSIDTNAVGATLGTSNNTPFRFWVVAFDNAGTVQLALINCMANGTIFPLTEYALKSTTAMSAAATSAGVFYTPNGVSLTSKAFCVLGFVEYSSGLTTAGTYNVAPTIVQVAGPFTPRPGAVIQPVQAQDTAQSTNATTAFANTTTAVSITPTSAANAVAVAASGTLGNTGTYYAVAQISRGGTKVGQAQTVVGAAQSYGPCALLYTDTPGSNGLLTYTVQIKTSNASGSAVWNTAGPGVGSVIVATEIMG